MRIEPEPGQVSVFSRLDIAHHADGIDHAEELAEQHIEQAVRPYLPISSPREYVDSEILDRN